MRALVQQRYGPLERLRLQEIDRPTPGPEGVLVRVRAAGVDPGIWHLMTGRPYMVRLMGLGFLAPKVQVAGWDAAGVVEAVGAGVSRFGPGDEVFGNCGTGGTGSFAEYACIPENRCAPRPASLTLEEAAAMPVSACTALQALRDVARVRAGAKVLVLGAGGGVGHFAVQIAKALGAAVTGVCSTSKLEFVRSIGADEVVDYARERLDDARRWDVIVDTAGRRSLLHLRGLLEPGGTVAVVGGEGGNAWTGDFLERMAGAALLSLGSSRKVRFVNADVTAADLLALTELVEAGKLRPHVERRYRLDEAVEALKELERGHARGKIVVVLD
ncbi:MAG TPA: NAD(P)-dependent alcohol dehydrogenase [Anaeromyxobacteraceae bacterium]|nr:NAD(P)-dependent alcohol dehydrogenase [Anaeromyxobacteraceae bacterium]